MGKLSKLIGDEVKQILDMSETARMSRAKDMGFDTSSTYYHGTLKADPIDELRGSQDGTYGKGVYLAPDAYGAEKYAGFGRVTQYGGSIYPLKVKSGKFWSVADQGLPRDSFSGTNDDIVKELKDRGYIGIDAPNERVVFDSQNIRSINAAFDPAKKDSSNLLAGALPVGAIGAASMLSPNESYAQTANKQATPRPDDVGSIKAPVHPRAAQMAGYFDKYNRAIEGTPLGVVLPEAPTDWANKLAYDGKTRIKDRIIAALGML
jgi:hypothetical protein